MKKLIYLLLVFPLLSMAQIPNAVGNGVTDDTSAIQTWLDSGSNLTADLNAVYKVSSTLDLDQSFTHDIDWNGSVIISNTALSPILNIDKRSSNGGLTKMKDLTLDGNELSVYGAQIFSIVEFDNVDATGFRQPSTPSPAGFRLNVYNDNDSYGTWIFDGCDIDDIVGNSNDNITDSLGAANGFLLYWYEVPTTQVIINFKNATIEDCFGEDAQNIALFSSGIDLSNSDSGTLFQNVIAKDWERRGAKVFCANNTFENCHFIDPLASDPGLTTTGNNVGLVVVGRGSGATGGDNNVFENCTFESTGFDGRIIVVDSEFTKFNNCTWIGGSDLQFTAFGQGGVGQTDICSANFGSGSTISSYGNITWKYNDAVRLDTDNVYVETNYNSLSTSNYQELDLICDSEPQPEPELIRKRMLLYNIIHN